MSFSLSVMWLTSVLLLTHESHPSLGISMESQSGLSYFGEWSARLTTKQVEGQGQKPRPSLNRLCESRVERSRLAVS
jgi:hypothetical protein